MTPVIYEIIVYICEAAALASFYLNLLRRRIKTGLAIILWAEAVALAMLLTPSFSFIREIVVAVFEFVVILISFEDKFRKKLSYFLFAELIVVVSSAFAYLLFALNTGFEISYWQCCRDDNCTYTLLYVISLSVTVSMVFQFIRKARGAELVWVLGTQIVIGIGECSAIVAAASAHNGAIKISDSLMILIAVACMVSANLSIGVLASSLFQNFYKARGIDFGKELSNMEYKYYEMSVENDKKLQEIRHDIANEIQTAYSLLISGDSQKSIELMDELKQRYGSVDRLVYCDNPVLNIILANKKAEAEKQNIEVQIKVKDYPKILPISDFDLSTVICNLLDNAIRGCICSNQTHPRLIVEIVKKNRYLVIRVLNSCLVSMNVENTDQIETTKSATQTHGFGMPIIAGIVKRYKGDFVVSAKNGLFTATVVMSLK